MYLCCPSMAKGILNGVKASTVYLLVLADSDLVKLQICKYN
jgi:hypothetical protein